MPKAKSSSKTPIKTFTGCWRCRERKVKCDGNRPSCWSCIRRREACPGYSLTLVWVKPDDDSYVQNRRRRMTVESTWSGHVVLTERKLSHILQQVEDISEDNLLKRGYIDDGPFGVFSAMSNRCPNAILGRMSAVPDLPLPDYGLLNHYVSVLADYMVPESSIANPWKTVYPRLAQASAPNSQSALLHALLAHSALHLSNISVHSIEYRTMYLQHYGKAISMISNIVQGSVEDYDGLLACLRILIMLDVYGDVSVAAWHHHLSAGWRLLLDRYEHCSGQLSADEWVVAQSLCLAQLREQTTRCRLYLPANDHGANHLQRGYAMIKALAKDSRFGFSIGAENIWLCALIETQFERSQKRTQELIRSLETALASDHAENAHVASCSRKMFKLGLLIYLKRQAAAVPPRAVATHVSAMFRTLSSFVNSGGQEPTVWPVFFAALEAIEVFDQECARTWLDRGIQRGIASRRKILQLLETVWSRRANLADIAGVPADLVVVDWAETATELEMDLPLVS